MSPQYTSAILVTISLIRSRAPHRFDPRKIRVTPGFARQIVALGLPSSLQNSIFAVANLFIQAGVNSFDSVVV